MKLRPLLLFLAFCGTIGLPLRAASLRADDYPGLRGPDGNLIPAVAGYLGQDLRSYDLPVDTALIKKRNNFGYSEGDIQKYFSVPLHLTLDETGMDKSFFKAPPRPGVHPRVIFNPEDVPLIKQRLETTQTGKTVWAVIQQHDKDLLTGTNAKYGKEYEQLASGDISQKPLDEVGFATMYEAFRCLVENDQAAGKTVAAVITSLAQIQDAGMTAAIEKAKPEDKTDFRIIGLGYTYQGTMGLDYDFAYNFMNGQQRDIVRKFLAHATAGMTTQAAETLRTLHCGTSNWISWSCRFLFPICAIEGEPGFDPEALKHAATAQLNYINAIFPSGEGFEGWGKSFMFLEHLVTMAKRGCNIIGSTKIRAAYNDYFIASLSPWGNGFTFCDSLAGSGGKIARNADVLMYHTFFPKDVAGDFLYRNQIDGNYNSGGLTGINTHHPFAVMDELCLAIFASDFTGPSWDAMHETAVKERPLTYFGEDTGNLITRSSWEKDALYLNYLTRQIPGGHQYCDRSHFSLYADGRFWSIYHFMRQIGPQYLPENRSVLLADGGGPSIMEARCAALQDNPNATFAVTDLKHTWDYQSAAITPAEKTATKVPNPFSYNDFRLHKSPVAWMDYNIAYLPDWYTSERPEEEKTPRFFKKYDVKKAFRTAGIVRGAHPYALIVDDLQLDDVAHNYDWGMILADDVAAGDIKTTGTGQGEASADIVLNEQPKPDKTDPNPESDRHLLVRVLSADSLTEPAASAGVYTVPNPPQRDMRINKLHITSNCVSPAFKILLVPYKEGQALPTTAWNASHTAATITWPDQTDTVTFGSGSDGRTAVRITRGGEELVDIR